MRKNRILFLLIICILGISSTIVLYGKKNVDLIAVYRQYDNFILGIPCVSAKDMGAVIEGKERAEFIDNQAIYFQQVKLPFDIDTQTFYLPQNYETDKWQGTLSADEGSILYIEDDSFWTKKKLAIQESHEFTIWLVKESTYYEFQLIITGTPVIEIVTEYSTEPEEVTYEEDPDKLFFGSELQYYGDIRIFDPGNASRKYELSEMRVNYHKKGASTKGFEKAGYSLSLLDQNGDNLDVSLLGMRSDNSWKLNALMTDNSKLREKTASQIWECFDEARPELNEAGPEMEYVELILDGDYRGVYCLVEPIDQKKMVLDDNDCLYKIIDWNIPDDSDIQYSADMGWKIIYPVRIRYPKVIDDYQAAWAPMKDYLNVFYRGSASEEEILGKVNIDNLFDMVMFTMATSGSDNFYKNTYYVAEVFDSGEYVMKQIPWDLDYTFGNVYRYGADNNVYFDSAYDKVYIEETMYQIMNTNSQLLKDVFYPKWQEYRETFLSIENVKAIFFENRDYLIQTGAIIREGSRWQEVLDTELSETLEYVELRLQWLDSYFSKLGEL